MKAPERRDAAAGLLLGPANFPGGLAVGVLAGVSPVSGLYGYLFGTVAGALATSSVLMSVQATAALLCWCLMFLVSTGHRRGCRPSSP